MSTSRAFVSRSEKETLAFARRFAKQLKPGSVLALSGDLGSGKTTFMKGLAAGLGLKKDKVTSPTFALMHIYSGPRLLYHFDLYRLETRKDFEAIGLEEFLGNPEAVSCVEWAEKAHEFLPESAIWIRFKSLKGNKRRIDIGK